VESDALAFCRPVTATSFTCVCGPGFWAPPLFASPQCIVNPCTNPNFCDPHASCAPLAAGGAQCACNDGYSSADPTASNPPCIASTCAPLNAPYFPFLASNGVVGTCIGLVTGQTCQVGCADGFNARGRTFTTCTGSPGSPNSYYSVPLFECIQETGPRRRRRDDDDDGRGFNTPIIEQPISPWECPKGGRCRPARPSATRTDQGHSASLRWLPLGTSPQGDSLTDLRVSIQSAFGAVTYSPLISNGWFAEGVVINNLQTGVTYTFRLVATINGQYVASDPVTA